MGHLIDHVVVCNWNERSPALVQTLHAEMYDQKEYANYWRPVVVVAEGIEAFPDDDHFEDTVLVPGSPLKQKLLKRANVQDAHTVIIVADDRVPDPDDRTLMTALAVRSVLATEAPTFERKAPLRIVAEVIDGTKAEYFRRTDITGINEVVCEDDLSVRAIAQASISPGVIALMNDLLEISPTSQELYLVPVPSDWVGAPIESFHRTFLRFSEEAGVALEQERARSRDHRESGRSGGVCSAPLLVGLWRATESGNPCFLINPKPNALEDNRFQTFRADDRLIVMARDLAEASLLAPAFLGSSRSAQSA